MMSTRVGYAEKSDATVLELPYKSQVLSLIIVLPGRPSVFSRDGLQRLEAGLNTEVWSDLMKCLVKRDGVKIKIPKFRVKNVLNTSSTLKWLGAKKIFQVRLKILRWVITMIHRNKPDMPIFLGLSAPGDIFLEFFWMRQMSVCTKFPVCIILG